MVCTFLNFILLHNIRVCYIVRSQDTIRSRVRGLLNLGAQKEAGWKVIWTIEALLISCLQVIFISRLNAGPRSWDKSQVYKLLKLALFLFLMRQSTAAIFLSELELQNLCKLDFFE